MIPVNQVRVGSFIYDDDGIVSKVVGFKPFDDRERCDDPDEGCELIVDIFRPNGVVSKAYLCESTKAEPIPLTPEILEKLGFELITWNGVIRHYFIPVTKNKRCALSFKFGEFKGFPDRLDTVSIGSMPDESGNTYGRFPIQYVHQLQNLIHDLTGTELDINL